MSDGVPQFSTAEYSAPAAQTGGAANCKSCGQAINGNFYRVNGLPACGNCTRRLQQQLLADSPAAFARGLLFGIGGAVLGLGIYVGFELATGLMIGYVALAVGFIVGKAITLGSGGRGGRRYQIAAVLLTYMAVSLSAVPLFISHQMKQRSTPSHSQSSGNAAATPPKMGGAKALGLLALIGLASPFLALSDPLHGIIGLIILFVGVRIAWKLTAGRRVIIQGPISAAAAAAPG
jgi:uncharacterized protein (DUF983 family)